MKTTLAILISILAFNSFASDTIFEGKRNRMASNECQVKKVTEFGKEYLEAMVDPTNTEFERTDFLNIGSTRIGPFELGTVDKLLSGEKFDIRFEDDSSQYGARSYNGVPFSNTTATAIWLNFKDDSVSESIARYNEISMEIKNGKAQRMSLRQYTIGAGKLGTTKKIQFYCTVN